MRYSLAAIATLAVASTVSAETNTQKVQFLVDAPEGLRLILGFFGPPVNDVVPEAAMMVEVQVIPPVTAEGSTFRYAYEAPVGTIPDGTAYACLYPMIGESAAASIGCVSNPAEPGTPLPLNTNYSFAGMTIPQEAFAKD
jgi:hypothetical protein